MQRKKSVYKGLEFTPVWFTDNSLTSPDFFQISEFPQRLTAGKNLFKLRGHPTNLTPGSNLAIEVLDYNGDPVYTEVINYINEDKSRVIAIYVYAETSPGNCTVTLLGESSIAPAEWQGKPNVKWSRTVAINPNIANDTEIIYVNTPILSVTEQLSTQLDRQYSGNIQFPTYSVGTVRYFTYNGQSAIELIGGQLVADMVGGTLTVSSPVNATPTPIFSTFTPGFTSTIKKILSNTTALLDTTYTVNNTQGLSTHTFAAFDASAYTITYEAIPTYIPTQNSESFAVININGLEPSTGDTSHIKIYMSNSGQIGTWELLNELELADTEIFIASTASALPPQSIGNFINQPTINTFWLGRTLQGFTNGPAPTLTYNNQDLPNSMIISNAVDLTPFNAVTIAQINNSYAREFTAGTQYKLTLDAIGSISGSTKPTLSIYMSGSALNAPTTDPLNSEFSDTLGKKIGQLHVASNTQRFDDVTFNFTADASGTGVILLVVESGAWQVADIRTTTDNDTGYTPNYFRTQIVVPTAHKANNQLSFKAEYYNIAGELCKQISYDLNKNWQGGNRYIDGDYSMLTGSLYVADSLETGVAISGYKNTGFIRSLGYQGFAAGFPGFLIWSGSALSGSLGTKGGAPYTGVGLELYANANNYFRYATQPSELDVRTQTFFLGDPTSQYISGSNGQLEISSSGFFLAPGGNVTASSFIALGPDGDTLFNSNSQFADGYNVGRVVFFNRNEFTHTGNIGNSIAAGVTASIFETFILPGETRMQTSFTCEFTNAAAGSRTLLAQWFIQSASITSDSGTNTGYDSWSTPQQIKGDTIILSNTPAGQTRGRSFNGSITTGGGITTFESHQGKYVRVYMVVWNFATGDASDIVNLNRFVYRTSRIVGSSTEALPAPIG
jgi:hypothetical protein